MTWSFILGSYGFHEKKKNKQTKKKKQKNNF